MSWLWQLGRLHTSNVMDRDNKKKTLTISSNLKKKIDTTQVSTGTKKSFSVKRERLLKATKVITNLIQVQTIQRVQSLKIKILQENLLNNKLQKHSLKRRKINLQVKAN